MIGAASLRSAGLVLLVPAVLTLGLSAPGEPSPGRRVPAPRAIFLYAGPGWGRGMRSW